MPRAKRTLAEADPNASAPAPAAKKASGGTALGKENQPFKSKTVAELSSMLKERGLPHTGKKADLVRRMEETSKTISRAGKATSTEVADSHQGLNAPQDTSAWVFVTLCRTWDDIAAEKHAMDDDYDSDEDEERKSYTCGNGECNCKKSPNDLPNCKWLITRKGFEMVNHLNMEALKRDQDAFDEYHYNDYTGYGFQEVVENHLVSFNKGYSKKDKNPVALWQHIEAFAHFLPGPGHWFHIDDSETLSQTLQLIGYTVIATLKVLESQDLLKPDSPVKDISLVLGLFMETVKTWPAGYEEPELSWVKAAICLAKKHGIIFEDVPFGVEQNVQKFEELEDDEDAPNWKKFNWKKEYNSFVRDHSRGNSASGIGGNQYDLTKKKSGKMWVVGASGF